MSEKRKKCATFCLKIGAKSIKVELFDAAQWEDGEPGHVRVRLAGRWHDAPDGSRLWLDSEDVSWLIQFLLQEDGQLPKPAVTPARPQVCRGDLVSLPCSPTGRKGEYLGREQGRIASEDVVLGQDGRWYVVVAGVSRHICLEAYEDLQTISKRT